MKSALDIPTRSNRYSSFLWNRNYQYCYTEDDILLLKQIQKEYSVLSDEKNKDNYFNLSEEKKWKDLWVCEKPSYEGMQYKFEIGSFTLPNREAKDSKSHPLWQYSDTMARQIANWQSERAKNQNQDLMNDPVMLVFEELKYWFYNILSERECRKEDLKYIAERQSYLKNLIHIIPNFGPDRLHLHEIQQALDEASKIVIHSIANKELPNILSDSIVTGRSLETIIGTYLHFLLIDEEVSDNFSHDYIEDEQKKCKDSPACKVNKAVREFLDVESEDSALMKYREQNKFYDLIPVSDVNGVMQVQLKLKSWLQTSIKFASFVTNQDKENYIEAYATLEALIKVRKTLEKFQNILPKIGTYIFAMNYLAHVDTLSTHYILLIGKIKTLIHKLIISADNGLTKLLIYPELYETQNKYFEKNLRALETKVAKSTTMTAQLENYSKKAIESMNKYQQEMKKLVGYVNSGQASSELQSAMTGLLIEMNSLITVIPAMLDDPYITIKNTPNLSMLTCDETSQPNCYPPALPAPSDNVPNYTNDFNQNSIVQLSAAQQTAPCWLETAIKWMRNGIPSISYAWAQSQNTKQEPQQERDQQTGRRAESSFTQALTLSEKFLVGRYIIHYAQKYSSITFPWNRVRQLTEQELADLRQSKKELNELMKTFAMQKTSRAGKSGIFSDQYAFIQKLHNELIQKIKKNIDKKKASKASLDDVHHKIIKIQEMIRTIAKENREVKQLIIKEKRQMRRHPQSISFFKRDVVNNHVTCQQFSVRKLHR